MNSDNEADNYENSENMTRRKLLGAAATSTTIFGSGCLDVLDGEEAEGGGTTPAPAPEYTEDSEYTDPPTETSEPTETASPTEEETTESATETSTSTEEPDTETEQTDTTSSYEVENPNNFGWESQDSLEETTGLCYLEDGYLGALDADEVESAVNEEHLSGSDPNDALNDGELIGSVDPLEPVEGLYAVDVDARHGDDIEYYVQLVGAQDGGVYLNRQGAYEVSRLEWDEVFNEC